MITIFKYPLTAVQQTISMPKDAVILHIELQLDRPCIWAKVNTDLAPTLRKFVLVGTGHDMSKIDAQALYIGTFQTQQNFVFHVFELI
jgi:hypothetical protein